MFQKLKTWWWENTTGEKLRKKAEQERAWLEEGYEGVVRENVGELSCEKSEKAYKKHWDRIQKETEDGRESMLRAFDRVQKEIPFEPNGICSYDGRHLLFEKNVI